MDPAQLRNTTVSWLAERGWVLDAQQQWWLAVAAALVVLLVTVGVARYVVSAWRITSCVLLGNALYDHAFKQWCEQYVPTQYRLPAVLLLAWGLSCMGPTHIIHR